MIVITKHGMPEKTLSLEEDTAEALLESLAEVLGARIDFDWAEKELDAECGSVYVERK